MKKTPEEIFQELKQNLPEEELIRLSQLLKYELQERLIRRLPHYPDYSKICADYWKEKAEAGTVAPTYDTDKRYPLIEPGEPW